MSDTGDKGSRRSCLFCGETPVTKEHLWPDWIRRLLREAATGTYTMQDEGQVTVSFQAAPYTLEVKAACQPCNGGWMSNLEGRVKPYLAGALQGNGRLLHDGGQTLIAAWATKTAMVYQAVAKRRIIPESHMREMYATRTRPPDETTVFMAGYGGQRYAGRFRNQLSGLVRPDEDVVLSPDQGDIYLVTFSVGPLVFQVFRGIHEAIELVEGKNQAIRRIFPPRGSFVFPHGPPLNDRELILLGRHAQS